MKKKIFLFTSIIFLQLLTSCEKDIEKYVDLDSFDEITEQELFSELIPYSEFTYYEIRKAYCGMSDYEVLFSHGEKCIDAIDINDCTLLFDSFVPEKSGFHIGCRPACCGYHIITQFENEISNFSDTESLSEFLGEIDSPSDALLLLFGNDYYFSYENKEQSAIKETNNGFQVIALKLVNDCTPYQIDKFLLEISREGEIDIIKQEVHTLDNETCI